MKSALVVIDIQNDITENYKNVVDCINTAIDWATSRGMDIIYIKHNNVIPCIRKFRPGTEGVEFVPELRVVSDNVFVKTKGNALSSDSFVAYIAENNINEFYVTGADATACVKSTCSNMIKSGYAVHVIADGVTSYSTKKLGKMLQYYKTIGCEVELLSNYIG